MTINNLDTNFPLQSVLTEIGFVPEENELIFDFGNCKLKAIPGVNKCFKSGFHFLTHYVSGRNAAFINFFLPQQVESYEQGLAYISYYLRNSNFKIRPNWLDQGLALGEHLPWNKEIKAFKERVTTIEHEWFRVLVKKIRAIIPTANDEDVTTFSFKKTVLKVVCTNATIVLSGVGKDWEQTATVKTKSLEALPKRIPNRDISIYIWKNKLIIENISFELESE